jgi:GNAT superfamily N-acetyltransferase
VSVVHFRPRDSAGWFLRDLRDRQIYYDDSGFLENLFCGERIALADETLFLTDEANTILALAIISKTRPEILGYYTIPKWRGAGHGYALLVAAILRILGTGVGRPIAIEPITPESEKHIAKLPFDLKSHLNVVRLAG